MKRITVLLFALMACVCSLQLDAAPAKGPARSNIYDDLPSGYQQLPPTSIYYNISRRFAAGPGYQYGVSILGKIGDEYYSSTYEYEEEPSIWNWWNPTPKPGAGFIAALQVNNGTPTYVNALNGTTVGDVSMTTRLEPQGNVAARVIYTVTNNGSTPVEINAGVYADIMIGTNDEAPLEMLTTSSDATYGIKMKHSTDAGSPLLCVLFGEHVRSRNDSRAELVQRENRKPELVASLQNQHNHIAFSDAKALKKRSSSVSAFLKFGVCKLDVNVLIVSPYKSTFVRRFRSQNIHYIVCKIKILRDIDFIILKEILIILEICAW